MPEGRFSRRAGRALTGLTGLFVGLTWASARRTRSSPGFHIRGLQPQSRTLLRRETTPEYPESAWDACVQDADCEWIIRRGKVIYSRILRAEEDSAARSCHEEKWAMAQAADLGVTAKRTGMCRPFRAVISLPCVSGVSRRATPGYSNGIPLGCTQSKALDLGCDFVTEHIGGESLTPRDCPEFVDGDAVETPGLATRWSSLGTQSGWEEDAGIPASSKARCRRGKTTPEFLEWVWTAISQDAGNEKVKYMEIGFRLGVGGTSALTPALSRSGEGEFSAASVWCGSLGLSCGGNKSMIIVSRKPVAKAVPMHRDRSTRPGGHSMAPKRPGASWGDRRRFREEVRESLKSRCGFVPGQGPFGVAGESCFGAGRKYVVNNPLIDLTIRANFFYFDRD